MTDFQIDLIVKGLGLRKPNPLGLNDFLAILNNRNEALRLVSMFRPLFEAAENKAEFAAIIRNRMIYDKFYEYSDDSRDYHLGVAHDTILRELKAAGY